MAMEKIKVGKNFGEGLLLLFPYPKYPFGSWMVEEDPKSKDHFLIIWDIDAPIPTQDEINAAIAARDAAAPAAARQKAYVAESDPLVLKAVRRWLKTASGDPEFEAARNEALAKVDDIKKRHPDTAEAK